MKWDEKKWNKEITVLHIAKAVIISRENYNDEFYFNVMSKNET